MPVPAVPAGGLSAFGAALAYILVHCRNCLEHSARTEQRYLAGVTCDIRAKENLRVFVLHPGNIPTGY